MTAEWTLVAGEVYTVARAGLVLGPHLQTEKPRKKGNDQKSGYASPNLTAKQMCCGEVGPEITFVS